METAIMNFILVANLVDIPRKTIYPAEITVENGRIRAIRPNPELQPENFILPGFVDAHVHIESSLLVPSEFARLAVVHGTVATISDPHEIANVCGMQGILFMIENGRSVPFKFNFGAPSCVPATTFETAGAVIGVEDVRDLMQRGDIRYLSEVMNFPGVLNGDPDMLAKIAAAKACNKPVDGHAPGVMGEAVRQYCAAGISTDHECFTREEALDKLRCGMKILIREGSAAKNFEALADLLHDHADDMMFCSDDKHPDSLVEGHINQLCARAVAKGIDVFQVLQAACINPVRHYNLEVGLLQEGDPADFILVNNLTRFEVVRTYVNGQLVAENGASLIERTEAAGKEVNNFHCTPRKTADFELRVPAAAVYAPMPVIEALDGQLITHKLAALPAIVDGKLVPDVENDILKIVVVNRYRDAPAAIAFIRNFGLKQGAIASSVAHDSHNIIAVGADDESICQAVNAVIATKGGLSLSDGMREWVLPLPVAGLMSTGDGYAVAEEYTVLDRMSKALGCTLSSPFMTLSFMALLVIPHLKLSDQGLFDGDAFMLLGQQ